jgi:hypothetical protein
MWCSYQIFRPEYYGRPLYFVPIYLSIVGLSASVSATALAGFERLEGGLYLGGLGGLCVHAACAHSLPADERKTKILRIYTSIALLVGILIILSQHLVALSHNSMITGALQAATVRVRSFLSNPELTVRYSGFGAFRSSAYGFGL